MSKVIAIGRREDILGFKAAGVELEEVDDREGAAAAFESIMEISQPCVVMVTEDLAEVLKDEIASFRAGSSMRAVLAIPTLAEPPGRTLAFIRNLIARALGVDLLGRDESREGPA